MQKILVIEDEELVRFNILELLEAEDFNAIAAESGLIGVELARKHLPDLIICDMQMPGLDGAKVLTTLRQDPLTAAIPFIFLTASSDKADLRRGMELGADDYLTKPCTPAELLQAIAARLTKQLIVTQLQQQVENLQHLSTVKDEFLSEASHDLRAPLANMKIAIELIRMATSEEQRNRYLNLLETECDRETALLNDLLDLQRLECNAYATSPQPLSLQTWVPFIAEPFELRAQKRQQVLRVEMSADLPPLISDSTSLGRVLTELLNNACKYTATGSEIVLKIHYVAYPTAAISTSNFIFEVSNQGEIPAKALPNIFNKFYRVPNSDRAQQGGTGLGLALVQKLVEQLEGAIEVISENNWTTFRVQLPAKPISLNTVATVNGAI